METRVMLPDWLTQTLLARAWQLAIYAMMTDITQRPAEAFAKMQRQAPDRRLLFPVSDCKTEDINLSFGRSYD